MTSALEKAQLANRDLTGNFSLKKAYTGQIYSIDDNSLEGRMVRRIVDNTNCGAPLMVCRLVWTLSLINVRKAGCSEEI
jgi:hypothetical protein